MGLDKPKIKYVDPPHTDATAIPEDVKKGKVFYNNSGRQIGNLEGITLNLLKAIYGNVKTHVFNKNNGVGTEYGDVHYDIVFNENMEVTNFNSYGYLYTQGYQRATPKINGKIVALEWNGKMILIPSNLYSWSSDGETDTTEFSFPKFSIFQYTSATSSTEISRVRKFFAEFKTDSTDTVTVYYV